MAIPVLTYHSARIEGNDYASNDHVAFFHDLRLLHSLGFRIARLEDVVANLKAGARGAPRAVAITLDDGTDFDYYDLPHPRWGTQRSMFNIMRDFVAQFGREAQPCLHATSFVVVSPKARLELDRTCLAGQNWYTDDWWNPAIASGLMAIANHSWDHNHPQAHADDCPGAGDGTFTAIDNFAAADAQIRQAAEYLSARTGGRATPLFAYPYGETNSYLVEDYLPKYSDQHGMQAAFDATHGMVTEECDVWQLPRFVFGLHWKEHGELAELLLREGMAQGTGSRGRSIE